MFGHTSGYAGVKHHTRNSREIVAINRCYACGSIQFFLKPSYKWNTGGGTRHANGVTRCHAKSFFVATLWDWPPAWNWSSPAGFHQQKSNVKQKWRNQPALSLKKIHIPTVVHAYLWCVHMRYRTCKTWIQPTNSRYFSGMGIEFFFRNINMSM